MAGAGLLCALVASSSACSREPPFKALSREDAEKSKRGFAWVPRAGGRGPEDEYNGGWDSAFETTLGVCRGSYAGGVYPGKFFGGHCNISHGGTEHRIEHFETLVAKKDGLWHQPGDAKPDLTHALQGGQTEGGKPIYVCLAHHMTGKPPLVRERGRHPGRYEDGKCLFGWNGTEVTATDFVILSIASPRTNTEAGAGDAGTCKHGEVPCACKNYTGCTRPGYCPCP